MPLERLRLHNFQCHDDLKIVLDPFVTTIVGPSDVGKSAVIRALRWAVENRPSGDAFVRDGESTCSVSLWLDGRKIVRRKGKAANEMIVDGQVFRAFGADVPEAVSDLLNLGEVNFQSQHDSPFWFALTAGQVSRELNGVVNLEVMDRTLAGVASSLRKARSVEEVCRERLEGADRRIEETSWVPEMLEDFAVLEKREKLLAELAESVGELEDALHEAVELQERAGAEVPDLSELEGLMQEVMVLAGEEELLYSKIREAKSFEDAIIGKGKALRELEERLERESGGICPICGSAMGGKS